MARKAYRCSIELNVHCVTGPGTWLPARDDCYLSVCVLGQYRRTSVVAPIFPILFHERLRFDRTFNLALDTHHVAELLGDEEVYIELVQLSSLYDRGVVLATYHANARDFLYPFTSMPSSYGLQEREVLMKRTKDFPGMSPKLEFSCKLGVSQITPYPVDSRFLDPVTQEEVVIRRHRTRSSGRLSRSRARSPSPRRHLSSTVNQYSYDTDLGARPPFVVRKVVHEDTPVAMYRRSRSRSPSASRRRLSPYRVRTASPHRYLAPGVSYPEYELGCPSRTVYVDDKLLSSDDNYETEYRYMTRSRSPRTYSLHPTTYVEYN